MIDDYLGLLLAESWILFLKMVSKGSPAHRYSLGDRISALKQILHSNGRSN